MEQYDSRVDAYIEKSADFAKPILTHLRELVHLASPEITETMKWSAPFFEYKGVLCFMMAFKQHAGFGFWKADTLPDPHGLIQADGNAGNIGKLTTLDDLPQDDILIWYIRQAMELKNMPVATKPAPKKAAAKTTELVIPDYLTTLLADNPAAKEHFEKFSPSQKKEYVSWFEEAKTEATRDKRLAEGISWMSEGKTRHWKYK
ncbi:YdeI/OmpD-associated family protein [Mucilaginibacter segetis]|uniref:YdeI/OmpD-associated family protein n=1 Tax=Mucilaginibacter segetis TaxID=2793071 RepID=A0A934PW40_9SPHI|nr:YdeI/OmpD-associated family protein [Mucilaginibacter segetis]MBK0380612.1 YdeI/OmpD-associated family protein [Mucilaginibacter segetis]